MSNPAIVAAFHDVYTSTPVTDAVTDPAVVAMVPPVRSESDRPTSENIDELQLALGLGAALSRISEQAHPWRELADALRQLPDVDTVAIFIVDELEHRLVVASTLALMLDGSRDCRWPWAAASAAGLQPPVSR